MEVKEVLGLVLVEVKRRGPSKPPKWQESAFRAVQEWVAWAEEYPVDGEARYADCCEAAIKLTLNWGGLGLPSEVTLAAKKVSEAAYRRAGSLATGEPWQEEVESLLGDAMHFLGTLTPA